MLPLANNRIPEKKLLEEEEADLDNLLAEGDSRSNVMSSSILGSKYEAFRIYKTLPKKNLPNDGTEKTNWPTSSKKLRKPFEESRPRKCQKMGKNCGVCTCPRNSDDEASGSWH